MEMDDRMMISTRYETDAELLYLPIQNKGAEQILNPYQLQFKNLPTANPTMNRVLGKLTRPSSND